MKKKIISLVLLLAMLVTAFPAAVMAKEEPLSVENGRSDTVDLHALYVDDGLVALFSVLGERAGTADLSAGTWTDVLGGKTATLGNAARWTRNALGGIGFNTFCGEMADGVFTANSTGNNYKDKTAKLDLGIALLPEGDFTVEYMAEYKPVYVYDAAASDKIARDAAGHALETYNFSTTATTNHAALGPIDYVGFFTAFTNALDATYYERGDIHWVFNAPTWGGTAGQWLGANWAAGGGLNNVGDVFQTNNVLRTYAITLDETAVGASVTALFALYRDAALYADNAAALNTTDNGGKDGGYFDRAFASPESFYLSSARPTDFYSVRIYSKVLSTEEQAQNRAVDALLYYGIALSAETVADSEKMSRLYAMLADVTFETDASAFAAKKAYLTGAIDRLGDASATLAEHYAAKDNLVALFSVYAPETVNLTAGTWTDVLGGKTATLGNANRWFANANGSLGFNTYCGEMAGGAFAANSTANNYKDKTAKLDFGIALLPEGDFTVEYLVMYKPVYVYNAAAIDKIARDADGKPIETYHMDKNATSKYAQAGGGQGMLDSFGYFSTMTDNLDGDYYNARGDIHYMFNWTGGWDASASNWVGARDWSDMGGLDSNDKTYQINNLIATYAFTLDEERVGDALTAAVAIYRDAVKYADNADEINSSANGTGDAGYIDAAYANEKFFLSAARPTDFYSVRIYSKVLSAEEQTRNRAIDVMYYYGITLPETLWTEEAALASVLTAFASQPFETDAVAYEAKKAELYELIEGMDVSFAKLYAAQENLVALFSVYAPATVNTLSGTWRDLVGNQIAILGGANRWFTNDDGSVGFNTFCGEMVDGAFTAASAGNNYTDKSAKLDLGISLLPEGDFTLEYMATYKPVYVYDANAEDKIARDADGNPLETYHMDKNATSKYAQAGGGRGMIDAFGYFTSMTDNLDGDYYNARGDIHFMFNWTGNWDASASNWVGAKDWSDMGGLDKNDRVFQENGVTNLYSFVLDETRTEDALSAYVALYKNGALYADNADEINSSANGTGDAGYIDAAYANEKFFLSAARPTDFFSVRVYDKVLSDSEKNQNRMIDLLLYYEVALPEMIKGSAGMQRDLAAMLTSLPFATDAVAYATSRLWIIDSIETVLAMGDVYSLYVQEGMVANYTALTPNDRMASVTNGTWANRVENGAAASLGNAWLWHKNDNGSVGFTMYHGMLDENGKYKEASSYNNLTIYGTRLEFGIDMLPKEDFTVEYVAQQNPMYVTDKYGNPVGETYLLVKEMPGLQQYNGAVPAAPVNQLGFLQAWTNKRDSDHAGMTARAGVVWTVAYPGSADATSYWGNACRAGEFMNDSVINPFPILGEVHTYAITRDEVVDAANVVEATYTLHRDNVRYATHSASVVTLAGKTGDVDFAKDDTGYFYLSERVSTDFYAVRIYDRVLSTDERAQNHLVDLLLYYDIEADERLYSNKALLAAAAGAVREIAIETDGTAYAANRALCLDMLAIVMKRGNYDYASLYVTEGLVGLYTAFMGDTTLNLTDGTWYNRVTGGENARLRGLSYWTKRDVGVGYSMTADAYAADAKAVGISLPDRYAKLENLTLEVFATAEGVTNADGSRLYNTYTPAVEDGEGNIVTPAVGKQYGYYTRGCSTFRVGLLSSLFFASLDAKPAQSMAQRWYVFNQGYWVEPGIEIAEPLKKQIGTDGSGNPIYDDTDQGWRKLGTDRIPTAGVMQITRETDRDGNVTFAVAYNGSETPEQSVRLTAERYETLSLVSRSSEAATDFSLFNALPATVYAIRVYDRVLTREEKLQNSFVDKAAFYNVTLTDFDTFTAEERIALYERFAILGTDVTAEEAQAIYNYAVAGDVDILANEMIAFERYAPILSGASGYRVIFSVNMNTRAFFETAGYTVTYGALVVPGGVYYAREDVIPGARGVVDVKVGGEGGSEVYYQLAGAEGYYYTAAVTASDKSLLGADVIVRGYAAITAPDGTTVYYYDDPAENAVLDGEVSILAATDYFVNGYAGDTATAYRYMNSAALRDILASVGYPARVSLADDLTIYVNAETGADGNSGLSEENAYRTADAAFAAAKAHLGKPGRKTVTIRLANGTYNVSEPLTLTGDEILADAYSFRVVGEGENTVLTSLREIDRTNIEYDDMTGAAYVTLSADENGEYPDFRTVYANGKLLNIASYGSSEVPQVIEGLTIVDASGASVRTLYNDWQVSSADASRAAYAVFSLPAEMFSEGNLVEYAGAELHVNAVWTSHVFHIHHVEVSAGTAKVYVPYGEISAIHSTHSYTGKNCYLVNALPLLALDENNDCYFYDEKQGRVYYKEGNEILDGYESFAYAALENIFVLTDVENVAIEGLTVTGLDSRYIPDEGTLYESQAGAVSLLKTGEAKRNIGFMTAAAVYAKNVDGLTVENVTLRDMTGAGVVTEGFAENVILASNTFTDLGDSAIRMGSNSLTDPSFNKNVSIVNNYVHDVGKVYKAVVAVQLTNAANTKIVGNTVTHVPYTAFSVGWRWTTLGYTAEEIIAGSEYATFNTEIAYNYVTDYMMCMEDGGAFYLLGGNTGKHAPDAAPYNYLHHNYVDMSYETGNLSGHDTGLRFAMGYYHDNSSSNWFDYENVLINSAKEVDSSVWYYAYYIQCSEGAEARYVALEDNYIVGVRVTGGNPRIKDVFMEEEVVNADFGISSRDYLYEDVAALVANTSIGVHTYGDAVTKESPTNAATTVASIFAAAGASHTPEDEKVSAIPVTAPALEREVRMDEELTSVDAYGILTRAVTFTDGEESVLSYGIAGSLLSVPSCFADSDYRYAFFVEGEEISLADYRIPARDITVTVVKGTATHTLTLFDGVNERVLTLAIGESITLPDCYKFSGYRAVLTFKGVEIDLATFKMPAEDISLRVSYEVEKHMVTFRLPDGSVEERYLTSGTVVPEMPAFDKMGYTTYFSVNGEDITLGAFTVPTEDVVIDVRYEAKRYTVTFVNKLGETESVYAEIETLFDGVIALPEAPTAFEADGYRYTFIGWVGYTEGMTLTSEGITFYTEWTAEEVTPDAPELSAGDINGDGVVDIADIVAVINKASGAELDAETYPGNTDINADGVVDIADIVAVINIASGSAS